MTKKVAVTGIGVRKYICNIYYMQPIFHQFTTMLTDHLNLKLSLKIPKLFITVSPRQGATQVAFELGLPNEFISNGFLLENAL